MEWRDEGLIIGVRRHGEQSAIVEAMTRAHGRHLGLVRGGRSARFGPTLQPGNSIGLVWRARLDEHLGAYAVEPLSLRAGRLMASALALAGLNYLAQLIRVLPERDPHEGVYETLSLIADALDDSALAPALGRPVRDPDPGRMRVSARSQPLRGDRRDRGPGLCLAQVGAGGERRSRGAMARSTAAAARFLTRGRACRGAAERGRDRRWVSPDRLLPGPRPVRAQQRAAA